MIRDPKESKQPPQQQLTKSHLEIRERPEPEKEPDESAKPPSDEPAQWANSEAQA